MIDNGRSHSDHFGNTLPAETIQPRRSCWKLKLKCDKLNDLAEEISRVKPSDLGKKLSDSWSKRLMEITSGAHELVQELSGSFPIAGINPVPNSEVNEQKKDKDKEKEPAMELPIRTTEVPICIHQSLTTVLYFILEATAKEAGAERAVVWVPHKDGGDMIGAVAYGYGSMKPNELRCSNAEGLVSSCYSSRIAVPSSTGCNYQFKGSRNVSGSAYRVWSALLLPLTRENGKCLGVLQLSNKYCGGRDFNSHDESLCFRTSQIFSYLFSSYPCVGAKFCPIDIRVIHQMYPLRPLAQTLTLHSFDSACPHRKQLVMRDIEGESRGSSTVVFYNQHGKQRVMGADNLVEVSNYISWLEQAWLAAVELNREYGQQANKAGSAVRMMINKLNIQLSGAKSEVALFKEMLDWRLQQNKEAEVSVSDTPQPAVMISKTKNTFCNDNKGGDTRQLPPEEHQTEWKPGDLATVTEIVDELEYHCSVLGITPTEDLSNLVGILGTVTAVHKDTIDLRIGETRGTARRGNHFNIPRAALISKAADETYLAAFLRRKNSQILKKTEPPAELKALSRSPCRLKVRRTARTKSCDVKTMFMKQASKPDNMPYPPSSRLNDMFARPRATSRVSPLSVD